MTIANACWSHAGISVSCAGSRSWAGMGSHSVIATWHHRLIDVESMAIPILGLEKPLGVSALAEKLEIEIPARHTALADCRAHRDIYDKLIELGNDLRGTNG